MTKKELLRAIKTCNRVFAMTHLTEHAMFPIQAVKKDLLFNLSMCDVENWTKDDFYAFIDKENDLYIG